MDVPLFPGTLVAELGAERWEIAWRVLTISAAHRSRDPGFKLDRTFDILTRYQHCFTEEEGLVFAAKAAMAHNTVENTATVQKQVVEWISDDQQDPPLAVWTPVGPLITVV